MFIIIITIVIIVILIIILIIITIITSCDLQSTAAVNDKLVTLFVVLYNEKCL